MTNETAVADHLRTTNAELRMLVLGNDGDPKFFTPQDVAMLPDYKRELYLRYAPDGMAEAVGALVDEMNERNRKMQRRYRKKGPVVYFVQIGNDGPIKIGTTTNLKARLASLRTSQPQGLALLAIAEGGRDLEKAYHDRFAAHRGVGEWFSPHADILREVNRLEGFH